VLAGVVDDGLSGAEAEVAEHLLGQDSGPVPLRVGHPTGQ
jgi:hypothetical protein